MHTGGTIPAYMDKAKSELSRVFQEFSLMRADQTLVNSFPVGWMHYKYSERGSQTEEYNVTFFLGGDRGVPFQIVCFTDSGRFGKLRTEFEAIIHSLAFPANRLWLPHISLYGTSSLSCATCGMSIAPAEALSFIKFQENKLQTMCVDCRKEAQ
jgi:hypothetical protein